MRLKYLKVSDYLTLLKLIYIIPLALISKIFIHKTWLVCEEKNDARDNGYWFFKYVVENHPDQKIFYAINKKSKDYLKVKKIGKVVQWGSLKHWILYLCASKNISSQKGGKPNAAICYLFEVLIPIFRTHRIFLQHGITKDDAKWLYYKRTKFELFICASQQEYEFIKQKFGYPPQKVQLLGFSRFDNLTPELLDESIILCMPSWRDWIGGVSTNGEKVEDTASFIETEYFIRWNEFLMSSELNNILELYNKKLIFYPHRNMQKYLKYFQPTERIIIASANDYDVQTLLKTAALLITDYSSVFFDFSYLLKPVIFYQFDYDKFRSHQYQEGYFDYNNNPIGNAHRTKENVLNDLNHHLKNNCRLLEDNILEIKKFFGFIDQNNSERIYNFIKGKKK